VSTQQLDRVTGAIGHDPSGKTQLRARLDHVEVRDAPGDGFTIRGHAAVFNRESLDLGGFKEVIAPRAFADVLRRNPDVHLDWDHDTRYVLARTTSGTLDLSEDATGLLVNARVAPTSYSKDLRILMERGDIDQMSFKFTVAEDTWDLQHRGTSQERVLRTVTRVGNLFDATVTAQGAYPSTDVAVVRSMIGNAISRGRLPAEARSISITTPHMADVNARKLAQLKARVRARSL
jgi:HK97 family phage prohead protease